MIHLGPAITQPIRNQPRNYKISTGTRMPQLPRESDSQRIGHLAVKAFNTQCPDGWRLTDLSSDSDVGLDFLVQIVLNGEYKYPFHAQVKGSTSDKANKHGEFFSVELRISTIEYLRGVGGPVMLVFADLSESQDPRRCPLYYSWIHEEIPEKLNAVTNGTKPDAELTFRVPIENKLDPELDAVPYLALWTQRQQRLLALESTLAETSDGPEPFLAVQQLTDNLRSRGASYLDSMLGQDDLPWANPTPGTVAWRLKQIHEAVQAGSLIAAADFVQALSTSDLRDDIERAEFLYQAGRLADLQGDLPLAAQKFSEAQQIQPTNSRYLCAIHELRLQTDSKAAAASEAYDVLSTSSLADEPRVKALRARCLFIQDRFEEGFSLLESVPAQHALLERALGKYLQGHIDELLAITTSVQSRQVSRSSMLVLRVLAIRARCERALGVTPRKFIPALGPADADIASLQECWRDLADLFTELRQSGWPRNSILVIDALASVGLATGRAEQALVFVEDFLNARPYLTEFQPTRLQLAVFSAIFDCPRCHFPFSAKREQNYRRNHCSL